MGFFNKIKKAIDVFAEDESVEKGNDFEKYVKNLFSPEYFSIVHWNFDITRKHDTTVEADMGPDFIFRYIPKNEKFCVECKFRSDLYDNKLNWSKPQQLERYKEYVRNINFLFSLLLALVVTQLFPKECFVYLLKRQNIRAFSRVYLKNLSDILIRTFSGKTVF